MLTSTHEDVHPSDIHLYTSQTPNGIKISLLLGELDLAYKFTDIDLAKQTQREPWFLEINPNGRIPAITDIQPDGRPIRIFESGAILQYIVDRYDTEHKVSYPFGSWEYYETNSWLFWQVGGLGPMQGQANHFVRYTPEKIQYGIDRYQNETRRLYRVLENHLSKSTSGYLVGDRLTIADISVWGWVSTYGWAKIDIEDFPILKTWLYKVAARPGIHKGRQVPKPQGEYGKRAWTEEELAQAEVESRAWVQHGMAEDAKK